MRQGKHFSASLIDNTNETFCIAPSGSGPAPNHNLPTIFKIILLKTLLFTMSVSLMQVTWSVVQVTVVLLAAAISVRSFYNIFFHPIRHVPGPFLAKLTRLWLFWHDFGGNPHTTIRSLHQKLGPVVRISPNEVSIDDVAANATIYSQMDPWVKPAYHYKAFQSSLAYSIFTELDPATHSNHLKLLAPSFSLANVASQQSMLYNYCEKLVKGMREKVEIDEQVGFVSAFRSFALDVVTDWTFGSPTKSLENGFESDLFEIFDIAAESVIYVSLFYLDPYLNSAAE